MTGDLLRRCWPDQIRNDAIPDRSGAEDFWGPETDQMPSSSPAWGLPALILVLTPADEFTEVRIRGYGLFVLRLNGRYGLQKLV